MADSYMNLEFRVVNMEHEMYNDGLYFRELAEKQTDYGDKQRCYRFAIVSFASSFEAFINARLKEKLGVNVSLINNGADILDFLINGFESQNNIPRELQGIKKKINLLEKLYGVDGQLINCTKFNRFNEEIILLRNSIVHYSHGYFTNVYGEQIENAASNGAELLRDTINSFVNTLQIKYPSYYYQKEYEPIK